MHLNLTDDCASTLAGLGRTEDVAMSPDGSILVVAGFNSNQLTLVQFRVDVDAVEISEAVPVAVEGLMRPHGLAFVDDVTLLVANRESELSLVRLDGRRRAVCSASVLIDGSTDVPVRTPGSVATRRLGGDLVEVFVCNNYVHDVTRYVLDGRQDWAVIDAELLLAADLDIPDGVAVSGNGDWIAISNHNRNAVHLYRYDSALAPDMPPTGVLRGVNYPHGLAFTADGRQLVVADAGLPNLYTFEAPDGDWTGVRIPSRIDRIMDEDSFHRGRYDPQEGGPKGLEIVADGIVAVTSEFQPLAFFALDPAGASTEAAVVSGAVGPTGGIDVRTPMLRLAQRASTVADEARRAATALATSELERAALEAELYAVRAERDHEQLARADAEEVAVGLRDQLEQVRGHHADAAAEMDRLIDRVEALEAHVGAMYASTSWRWSAALRAPSWLAHRLRSLRR